MDESELSHGQRQLIADLLAAAGLAGSRFAEGISPMRRRLARHILST